MSKSITNLKTDYQQKLREKTAPGSISRMDHADMMDDTANELRDRGVITVANTAALATQNKDNTLMVIIYGVGVFRALQTATAANNKTTFNSSLTGWLWERFIDLTDNKVRWFKVGVTAGAPANGDSFWKHEAFIGRTPQFFTGSLPIPGLDPEDGTPWADKDETEEDRVNFHNYSFSTGNVIGFIV